MVNSEQITEEDAMKIMASDSPGGEENISTAFIMELATTCTSTAFIMELATTCTSTDSQWDRPQPAFDWDTPATQPPFQDYYDSDDDFDDERKSVCKF